MSQEWTEIIELGEPTLNRKEGLVGGEVTCVPGIYILRTEAFILITINTLQAN